VALTLAPPRAREREDSLSRPSRERAGVRILGS
jgi:hypothetical protein